MILEIFILYYYKTFHKSKELLLYAFLIEEKIIFKSISSQTTLILFDILTVLSLSRVMNGWGNYITPEILLHELIVKVGETNLTVKLEKEVRENSPREYEKWYSFDVKSQVTKLGVYIVKF